MTKTNACYKLSMRKFIIALVTLSWLIPGLTPLLRWVDRYAISYFFITTAVKKQEALRKKQYLESKMTPLPSSKKSLELSKTSTTNNDNMQSSNTAKKLIY